MISKTLGLVGATLIEAAADAKDRCRATGTPNLGVRLDMAAGRGGPGQVEACEGPGAEITAIGRADDELMNAVVAAPNGFLG